MDSSNLAPTPHQITEAQHHLRQHCTIITTIQGHIDRTTLRPRQLKVDAIYFAAKVVELRGLQPTAQNLWAALQSVPTAVQEQLGVVHAGRRANFYELTSALYVIRRYLERSCTDDDLSSQ